MSALLEINASVDTSDICVDEPRDDTVRETLHTTDNYSGNSNTMSNDTGALDQEVQTEITCQTISELELDNRARVFESSCLKSCTIYDREMYVGAPDKSPNVFDLIHDHLTTNGKLSKYQPMLLVSSD